jgi:hypothetical protein
MATISSGRRPVLSASRDSKEQLEARRKAQPAGVVPGKGKPRRSKRSRTARQALPPSRTGGAGRNPEAVRQERRPARVSDWADHPRGIGFQLCVQIGVAWQTDAVMVNQEGQRVWVKDAFTSKGQRVGAGPCCLESDPCRWHKSLSRVRWTPKVGQNFAVS